MKAYLKKFGTNGKHIQEAKAVVKKKNRVVVLILTIILLLLAGGAAAYYFLRPTEAKAWNAASSENTYAAYQNYLNAYGNAVESEAKAHQDKAKTNMLKLSKDNPDQLNEIAKLYPNTDYAQEAKIRLTEINLDSLRTFIPIISELNMNFEEPIKKLNRYYSATQNTLNDMQIELPSELRNDIMLVYEELNAVVSNQLQSNLNAAKAFKNDAEIFNPAMANVRSLMEYLGLDNQLKATTTMQLDKLQK